MSGILHRVYISVMVGIGFLLLVWLTYYGYSYYAASQEERPFHHDHAMLKPSGPIGHGLGILGTLLILIGVFSYIGRKKQKFLPNVGSLKYWLEFHIFLCSIGPLLILFHTAFKFGGIVSISFWSMVAVVLSGIIGRFIYIQIPRTIQGRELSLSEIRDMKETQNLRIKTAYGLEQPVYSQLIAITDRQMESPTGGWWARQQQIRNYNASIKKEAKQILTHAQLSGRDHRGVMLLIRNELKINKRIRNLQLMQMLFKNWHIAHLPFALIMLVIMVIHVIITITFGYRWIF
ncbi:MAG TPA: hypothetical protein VJ508_11355 [Saprospiraceae bacterium]|nr:hypothetical protein [Saprospiraceae bacterium]